MDQPYRNVSTLDLWDVCRRLEMAMVSTVAELRAAIGGNSIKIWSDHDDEFYSEVVRCVSVYALSKVHRQVKLLQGLDNEAEYSGVPGDYRAFTLLHRESSLEVFYTWEIFTTSGI
ncbi:hypothetical protein PsorP6_014015 [Peronosclerospora sorghi]|uniref:Uncharacterized protein n=1 Tax=Peronosclerospora sorghi TaxID=230839 RepID=A0ACC0VI11_9STRA|nr:hypothetical protein PsorP6_014015 [Peronosclerospora sorghi]